MSILLRSLLFLSFGVVLSFAAPLFAQGPPPVPVPVLPRQSNAQLERLSASFSRPSVTDPLVVRPAKQEVRLPEQLPPPNSVNQASFSAYPLVSSALSDGLFRNESSGEKFSEYAMDPDYGEDEESEDLHHAMLDRPLGDRTPKAKAEDGEVTTDGWKNKLAMPNFQPIITVGGTLLIVIASFFILALFLRKVSPQGNRALPKEALECLGRYYLTQKHQVQLLRVGSRIVLVSVMPEGVSTLAEITEPDEAVALLGLCRRLDTNSATEFFRKTVANLSEEDLSRPSQRPVVAPRRGGLPAASLDLYSEPDESLAAILAKGKRYGR